MSRKRLASKFLGGLSIGIALGLGLFTDALHPKPVQAAERIRIVLGPLDLPVSLASLEAFAKEGQINSELALLANRLSPQKLALLRQILQTRFPVDAVTVDRFTYIQMGEALLKRLGLLIQPRYDVNGFHAIRAALILAAADSSAGFTPLNVIRHFPTPEIRVNATTVLELVKQVQDIPQYQAAVVQAVTQAAQTEASSESRTSPLPDLGQPGPYRFTKKTITIPVSAVRQTQQGFVGSYSFPVDLYIPEGLSQPAPLVVMTHGFGSTKETYGYVLEHLASQGIVIAAPEHIGSDLYYRQALLAGTGLSVDISPLEYLNRPLEISYTIDEIERLVKTDADWAKLVNLEQIGVLGNSFGATTALSAAGATINVARLRQECVPEKHLLNFSVLLQCRAAYLPPQNYNFGDRRIKAVFAAYPLTSVVFGPEGLSTISIPTFILAGSRDVFTPVAEEQVHPFIWLTTPTKYLGLMIDGTHFSTATNEINQALPGILRSPAPELGRKYIYALSTAFFYAYLTNRPEYLRYLTSSYADVYGQEPLDLRLVRSLAPSDLETAYGGQAPEPIIPSRTTAATPPQRPESVLQQIQRTGVLKVAFRSDAAPLGYIDSQRNVWTGYCADLANSLSQYLTQKLNSSIKIEVVPLQSTIENRFQLVQSKTVVLECGPNSIRSNVKDIVFSNPFFATGTQFLVKKGNESKLTFNNALADVKTGVLKGTLTEQFVRTQYPQAKTVDFEGPTGRAEGVQALTKGTIDTLSSDGVLAIGEILRQNLPVEDYALLPEQPLTCDFYGLILPNDDTQWQITVNSFLQDEQAKQLRQTWFKDRVRQALVDSDYCLNQ